MEEVDSELLSAIVLSFCVIILGAIGSISGLFKSEQTSALGTFVSYFALPALIFRSLAALQFNNFNWSFFGVIVLVKVSIFLTTLILFRIGLSSRYFSQRSCHLQPAESSNSFFWAKAGLFAVFLSQTNDLALGIPVIEGFYGEKTPFLSYLYLFQPIALVLLNPIAFVLLEHWSQKSNRSLHRRGRLLVYVSVLGGLLRNPVFLSTLLGVCGNGIFGGRLPAFVDRLLRVFANAFSALALFFLGACLATQRTTPEARPDEAVQPASSSASSSDDPSEAEPIPSGNGPSQSAENAVVDRPNQPVSSTLSIAILVTLKIVVCPLLAMVLTNLLLVVPSGHVPSNGTVLTVARSTPVTRKDFETFAFLYSALPAANAVFLYAVYYRMAVRTIGNAIIVSVLLSGPVMYISGRLIELSVDEATHYHVLVEEISMPVGFVGIASASLLVLVISFLNKFRTLPHRCIVYFSLAQFISCSSIVLHYFLYADTAHAKSFSALGQQFVQAIYVFGVFSSRLGIVAVATALWASTTFESRLAQILRTSPFVLAIFTFLLPLLLVGFILVGDAFLLPETVSGTISNGHMNPTDGLIKGSLQLIISIALMLISLFAVGYFMIRIHCNYARLAVSSSAQPSPSLDRQISDNDPEQFPTTKIGRRPSEESLLGSSSGGARSVRRHAADPTSRTMPAVNVVSLGNVADDTTAGATDNIGHPFNEGKFMVIFLWHCVSVVLGCVVCVWHLISSDVNGLFVGLEVLDVALNHGLVFISLILFGFNWSTLSVQTRQMFDGCSRWRICRWCCSQDDGSRVVRTNRSRTVSSVDDFESWPVTD